MASIIRRMPLKSHIYAGLTAEIKKKNPQLADRIVRDVVSYLQSDLNNLKLYEAINCVLYLSELMNLEVLNSLCFFNIVDDIMAHIENPKKGDYRQFFILVFVRTLHNFSYSLNKKVLYDFKKLMEKAKKYCSKNAEFMTLY
jgi:hypothetical protein